MNIAQIENNLQQLIKSFNKDTFVYDLLSAYGFTKYTITMLRKGSFNLSGNFGEVLLKNKMLFKVVSPEELHSVIEIIKSNPKSVKHSPRFIIITDYETLLALDRKTDDSLDIPFFDIAKHYDFFLPWAGMEKAQQKTENPADVRAAEKMAKLYDEIKKDNPATTPEEVHSLNVFLSRLLFCFFAEDTDIFDKNLFTNSISSHTQLDGSDLSAYLNKLFEVMNTESGKRKNLSAFLEAFPYVNGGLFRSVFSTPVFSRRSRQAIIDSGNQQWKEINPDIFGSMIQAVITPEHRGGLGMHYTSVPNIMKVIEPLFLNDLYEEFEKQKNNKAKLEQLLNRIYNLKIFDPACGSGNFLIISYKELRKLEMLIFKQLEILSGQKSMSFSRISLNQFFGIELDDFAHEIAMLSLWLAEHQMNQLFFKEFGRTKPALPLSETGRVVCGNACRLNWEEVCPKNEDDEIFILGNPPYLGARVQSDFQKNDMEFVFDKIKGFNNLDYISCWFFKGSNYINGFNAQFAFVTTNSICQGEQVSLLWPNLLINNIEISFAHLSFKWSNNAKANAGVTVAVIGLRNKNTKNKFIYTNNLKQLVGNINCYLVDSSNIFIDRHSKPISNLPEMCFGSMANDGGFLFLNEFEKNKLINDYPEAFNLVKKLVGALEFIRGENKYCLWINDSDLESALQIPVIANRIENCRQASLSSKRGNTNELASTPHKFAEIRFQETDSIIVPSVSSERREYIPMGYLDSQNIIVAPNFAIYNAKPWILSILFSKMHMTWVRSVAGRLKTDYRYSASLCYNAFPFPDISELQKTDLEKFVFQIFEQREKHSEKSLAILYDPDKMPLSLKEAHQENDLAVERCYRSKPFTSDEERLEYLFNLYEQMIAEEKIKGTLFNSETKIKTKKK